MKKMIFTAGASVLALLGAASAIAAPGDTSGPRKPMADMSRAQLVAKLDARFAKLDLDRDGTITRDEMQQARKARHDARFAKLDTDGNGSLSRAEFDAPRGGLRGHHGHRRGHGMMDTNKDGTLTKAEFESRALAHFDRMDANHDGVVTVAERQAAWSAMKARHAPPSRN